MIGLGLRSRDQELLRRPDANQPAYSTLAMLGRVLGETHERYCMTALLLAEERRAVLPLKREKFEEDCRLLAERMAIDRKSVVYGKSVSVRVDLGGRRIIKKKKR